jgi:hypothetical protein
MDHEAMSHPPSHGTADGLSPTGMTPQEELAYTLFMHRSSGAALLALGALVWGDRLTGRRHGIFRGGIGLCWLAFGAFLFVRSDVEGWPIGPAGFLESFSMPTAGEWLQHKVLSLIPVALGIWTFTPLYRQTQARWSYALGALIALGAGGLLLHMHLDHPTMDIVNIQHRFMALTAFLVAFGSVADGSVTLTWKVKPWLVPSGLFVLGLQLVLYVE